jgi:hypothetical protein
MKTPLKQHRKLRLASKETLRKLSGLALRGVAGGDFLRDPNYTETTCDTYTDDDGGGTAAMTRPKTMN